MAPEIGSKSFGTFEKRAPGYFYFRKGCVYLLLAFRKAVEGLVRVDSQEMRAVVDREVAKQENVRQQIIKEYQNR